MKDKELELFLNWFVKQYYSTSDDLSDYMYYVNYMREEVTIKDILEHYNEENSTRQA